MLTEESDCEENFVLPKDSNLINVSFNDVPLEMTPCITLFVCDHAASVTCQHFIKSFGMVKIAAVFTDEPIRKCISEKFFSIEQNICLIELKNPLQLSEIMLAAWLELVTDGKLSFAIILSSISRCSLSVNHIVEREKGVRKLNTMAAKKNPPALNFVKHIPDLEIGNIVSGISAALINFFEARSLPAVLVLSITESSLSGEIV